MSGLSNDFRLFSCFWLFVFVVPLCARVVQQVCLSYDRISVLAVIILYYESFNVFFFFLSLVQVAKVEHVTPALELGEGPHWNPSTQSLYFVDLHRGKINRYHPESKKYFCATIGTDG